MLNYLKDVRAEMKHVTWPTRTQTIMFTIVVMLVSAGVAVYLGLWDYLFAAFLKQII